MVTSYDSAPESLDGDRLWKWVMFYLSRQAPRLLLPKRNGLGLTVDFIHRAGLAFIGGVVPLLLATITVLITF